MAWCESEGIDYVFGLAQNARLQKQIEAQMAQAAEQYQQTQAAARVFTEFLYATEKTWAASGVWWPKRSTWTKAPIPASW